MEGKLITIGIPVYNAELYLERAIKSVLQQTYSNFELIISDDGSTDRSYEIITSFNDPRIIVIRDGDNKGTSYRLNQQINIARGEYFARMDADDVMFPERIKKQVEVFETHTVDVLYTDAISIDNYGNIIGYKPSVKIKNVQDILNIIVPIHPTVMTKTKLLKEYSYNDPYIQMGDLDLWYRLIQKYKFVNITEPMLFYRENSTRNSIKHKKMIKEMSLFSTDNNFPFKLKTKLVLSSWIKYITYSLVESVNMDKVLLKKRYVSLNKEEIDKYAKIYALTNP